MHQTEELVAISTKKQSAYGTALIDADIDKVVVFDQFAIATHEARQITDVDKLGKSHEFATAIQMEAFSTKRNFTWDANSLNLPWALAFLMGDVTTSVAEASKAWQHIFKFMDKIASGGQPPATSIIEKIGGFETRKVPSLCANSVTLSGELEKRINLTVDFIGSGRITTTGITAPSTAPYVTSYFINQMMTCKIGPKGGTLVDVGADFHRWSLTLSNNLQQDLGYFPGAGFNTPADPNSGAICGRMETGKRTCTLELGLRVKAGSTQHTELIANTRLALNLKAEGALIPTCTTAKWTAEFDFVEFAYEALEIGTVGDGILLFTLKCLPMYASAQAGPVKATIITDVPTFLVAAT